MNIFGLNGLYHKPIQSAGGGGGGAASYYITLDSTASPVATATWPSHFSVPIESGSLSANYAMRLTQQYSGGDETYKAAQFEPASYWPDGSVKWLHIYSNLEWSGGVSPDYKLRWGAGLQSNPSTSLSATTTASGIRIDTGTSTFTILNNSPIINSGQYYMTDAAGNTYTPADISTTIESSGRAQIVVKVAGNLKRPDTTALSKFVTYITANANSDIVKYQHSCIFTADMRQNFVASLGLRFNSFSGQVLTRDFDKKLPYTAFASGGNTYVMLWPSGRADSNTASDWAEQNAFRFAYLHKGSGSQSVLNINMPTGYINTCSGLLSDVNYLYDAIAADLYGLSMDIDFAINLGSSGSDKQTLFTHNPIGLRETLTTASAKAAENVGAYNEYYNNLYDNLFNAAITRFVTNDLTQDYGWHRYGGTYNTFYASGQINGNPYSNIVGYHRLSSHDHYNVGKLAYLQFIATAHTGCLKTGRIICDHNRAVALIKHDNTSYASLSGRYIGTQAHVYNVHGLGYNARQGASYNSESWALTNHFVHPSRFVYSWLVDSNRMMKDAYEAWIAGTVQRGTFDSISPSYNAAEDLRDYAVGIGEALTQYEMYPDTDNSARGIAAAHRWVSGVMRKYPDGPPINPSGWTDPYRSGSGTSVGYHAPYLVGRDGTLLAANDTFIRYAEMFPNTTYSGQTVEDWIVKTANTCLTGNLIMGYRSYCLLAAKAYEITGSGKFIAPMSGMLSQVYYNVYQNNDQYYGLSTIANDTVIYTQRMWPRMRKTLNSLAYQIGSGYNRTVAYPSYGANDAPTNTDINNYSMRLVIQNNTGSPVALNQIQISYLRGETRRNPYKSFFYLTTSGTANTGTNLVGSIPPADLGGATGVWVSRPPYPTDNGYYFVNADINTTLPTGLSYLFTYGYEPVKSPVTNLPEAVYIKDGRVTFWQNNSGVFRPLVPAVTGQILARTASSTSYATDGAGYIKIGGSGRWIKQLDSFDYVFTGDTSILVQGEVPIQIVFATNAATDTFVGLYGTVANLDIIQPLL